MKNHRKKARKNLEQTTQFQCESCGELIPDDSANETICDGCAEDITDDWDREMLGDDYYALSGMDIGDK